MPTLLDNIAPTQSSRRFSENKEKKFLSQSDFSYFKSELDRVGLVNSVCQIKFNVMVYIIFISQDGVNHAYSINPKLMLNFCVCKKQHLFFFTVSYRFSFLSPRTYMVSLYHFLFFTLFCIIFKQARMLFKYNFSMVIIG